MFDVNLVATYGFDDDAGLFHGFHYGLPVVRRKGTMEAGVKLAHRCFQMSPLGSIQARLGRMPVRVVKKRRHRSEGPVPGFADAAKGPLREEC
jgi:hypothetical protein